MTAAGLEYYADVPADTKVSATARDWHPPKQAGKKARKPRVLHAPCASIAYGTTLTMIGSATLRPSERGMLQADFARMFGPSGMTLQWLKNGRSAS